jgi:glycerol-3-phosphate O-acyltransferase
VTLRDWLLFAAAALLAAGLALWTTRRATAAARARVRRWARRTLLDFQARIARYKLVSRRAIHDELVLDPAVVAAMRAHMRERGLTESDVRLRVEQYIDEILPFFNVLSYYKLGYNLARMLLNLLYRVSIAHQDHAALDRIPRRDVVVYLMNHRSNADYVVVAYVLARGVALSYAVGEWARVWPLEYVFKSFGSYFIRRRYREPLYHTVLERYVQLITAHGVTQGIFLEGGLSRDGRFRPAKIGLLDYVVGALREPAFGRDIWFVPVAINYDRVLEDRTLIRECLDPRLREGKARQLFTVVQFVAFNTARLLTGRLRRYGRAAVSFGAPLSLRAWLSRQDVDVLGLARPARLPHIQRLADEVLESIKAIIPVTPVSLASAALLSFDRDVVLLDEVQRRMSDYRDHLLTAGASLVGGERDVSELWARAMLMFRLRRTVIEDRSRVIVVSRQRPLLEYYANAVRHLLPAGSLPEGQLFSPAQEVGNVEAAYRLSSPRQPSVAS